jgi:hypothetical protein
MVSKMIAEAEIVEIEDRVARQCKELMHVRVWEPGYTEAAELMWRIIVPAAARIDRLKKAAGLNDR